MNGRGFLFIELLFALFLLGAIVAVSLPATAANHLILEQEGMLLASDVRWLRQYSLNMARGHEAVPAAGTAPVPKLRISRTPPGGYIITSATKILRRHVFAEKVSAVGENAAVSFSANGSPNRPLTILLQREDETVCIVVDRVGRVRME